MLAAGLMAMLVIGPMDPVYMVLLVGTMASLIWLPVLQLESLAHVHGRYR